MQSVEEQPTSELVLLFVDLCVEITEIKERFITHKTSWKEDVFNEAS